MKLPRESRGQRLDARGSLLGTQLAEHHPGQKGRASSRPRDLVLDLVCPSGLEVVSRGLRALSLHMMLTVLGS